MKNNLINLTDADLDKPVYRIFSFARLAEVFEEKKLTLVKPKKWDDPFENFILNSTGVYPDGTEMAFSFRDNFYGQCWTLTMESDAMWRIYSPDKYGVKVKTTIRKLLHAFAKVGHPIKQAGKIVSNPETFIGKVNYSKTSTLISMFKHVDKLAEKVNDSSGKGVASTFYFKRLAFKHEKEVRLIYYDIFAQNKLDTFKIDIDPLTMFDEIVFDPRMDERIYRIYKNQLKLWNYQNRIIQSGLYKLKAFKFQL